jgi:hypothetical protein
MAANTSRINLTIGGIQEAKKQLDELKSAIEQTENKAEKNKLTKSYKELEKEVKNATKAFDELDSSGKRLTSRFDEIYGDIQPLSGRIGELEDRLYELFLAGEQNSEEFKTITGEVARMKKVIIEVDKSVDLLAENQGISVFSSGISQIGERLLALDFVGAEKDAKALNSSIGNLSKMGSQAIKGMAGTVVQLSRAFMSMGAALLANPIFLIAAAIVGIVTIIGVLLNKLGLLKPILNAIGKAFEFVKSVIDAVVQSIKDFLDWLGLTSFAAEEAAGRQAAAQEKVAQAFEDKRNKVVSAYDQEIALAQIAGEDTVDLERKKQQAIIETSRAQYRALEAQRDALRAQGVLTAEQSKAINESMRTLREGIEGARKQIELINAKEVADNKKKNEEVEKSDNESYKKRIEDAKKYAAERINVQRQIRDLEISIQEDSFAKEVAATNEKYLRIVEDIQKNEALTFKEKKRLLELYAQEEAKVRGEIQEKYAPKPEENTGILPPPDVVQNEMDNIVKIQEEGFSNMERLQFEFNDKSVEGRKKRADALLSIEQSLFAGTAALGEIFIKDSKKLEQFQKAQALVQIGIDTALAISALVKASQQNVANGVTGGLAGAVQFASGLAQILTNVAKAKQLLTSPSASASGGGGGAAASSSSTSTQAMQPSFSLFGQANQGNNASSSQSVEQSNSMTIFAKVSAVDMTAEQASNQKNMQMATL